MNKSLILVPVYPPHFHWARQLLDSASASENIALGFSNQKDADNFSHPFPFIKLISNIDDNEACFIGKKKLNLLEQIYSDYEFIAIIDAESTFIKPTTESLGKIWDHNCFLANHSEDGSRIIKDLAKVCGYEHQDDLYPWFNSIPIFKCELLPLFFKWLESKQEILKFYIGFEFLLFALYCRYELNMPWRTLEGNAWHGLVENSDVWRNYPNLIQEVPWSTWIPGIENYPNIHMIFHIDRYRIQ